MQLVAYGAQDIYLTGNPQITFFKVVYRRHTNFATEAIEQTFTGSIDFGRKVSCTVDRNGDLLHKMYLEMDVSLSDNELLSFGPSTYSLGHAMIREVEIEIGGQSMDTHYGEWLELWSQLTCSEECLKKCRMMTKGNVVSTKQDNNVRKLYVPLQFWFNRNPGLALPLIALQYHEVKLNLFLNDRRTLGISNNTNLDVCLFCDYIFLDTDERRRFAQVSHEYLIDQVQFNNIVSVPGNESNPNIELRFNHPCKELIWVAQPQIENDLNGPQNKKIFNFSMTNDGVTNNQEDTVLSAKLQLNGHDRFREREGTYFRCVQPYQHHTGANLQDNMVNGYFYVYSFALKPEEHQPSGTCNFSRIDNAVLQLNLNIADDEKGRLVGKFVKIYATNYNVLRIMSGMGGLAYSN
jgi:hypothetical protein